MRELGCGEMFCRFGVLIAIPKGVLRGNIEIIRSLGVGFWGCKKI